MPLYRKIKIPGIIANSRLFHLFQIAYADNQSLHLDCFAAPEASGIGKDLFLDRETLKALFHQNYSKVVEVSHQNHVLLWFQNYHSKGFLNPTDVIDEVFKSLEAEVVDQKSIFKYADDNRIRVRGKDNWHPNGYGYSLIARLVFNKMVEKRILQGPTYDLYHELDLIKSYIEKKESGYQFLKIYGDSPFEEKAPLTKNSICRRYSVLESNSI